MALARLVTFVPFTLIKSADVNGEFNNILNNPISLISPTTGPINFNLQPHTNLVPSAITGTSGSVGQSLIVSSSGGVAFGAGGGNASPSRVSGLLGFISSQSGTFSADSYIMRTTSGSQSWTVSATSSYSASVGTAGPTAGGRDIAGAFASTYVHWYAISTGALSTAPAGLVSTNPPNIGPVALPTGYIGWTYLGGSPYTSASTTVLNDHHQRGNLATLDQFLTLLSAGTATVETPIALSSVLPSNASRMVLTVRNTGILNVGGGNAIGDHKIRVVSGSDYFVARSEMNETAGGNIDNINAQLVVPNIAQTLFYLNVLGANTTSGRMSIDFSGWVNPNGDV